MAPRLAAGLAKVLEAGAQPGAGRPSTVISFEPLLIKAAGEDVTLLHAGRSSQDMHATYRSAILRDKLLELADQLNQTSATLVALAGRHAATIVPNHQRRGRAAEQLRPLPAGAGGGADARCAAHPRGVCPHRPLADGHHGAQWHQLAAGPRAHGALSGLRGAGGQRLRRRADLVHGPAGGGGVYRRQHRAAHRQLRRGRLDAVRAVAPVDPAGRGRRQYLRVQRHAAEAQRACSTTRAAMRPRR